MADTLSIGPSVLAIITAAIQSTNSLCATVGCFKERSKTLRNLKDELEDLSKILNLLEHAVDIDAAILSLLQGPVERCSRLCSEFEQSMKVFSSRSKVGFRDWAKMEFRRGNISEFAETIGGYKATISVGLGIITMQMSKVSYKVLQEYNEMVQDTSYNINIYLRRIDEKLARLPGENTDTSAGDKDLEDEREITKQCLRICEDAKIYLESCTNREPSLLQGSPQNNPTEDTVQNLFEAQQPMRQALEENQKSTTQTIIPLQERLANLVANGDPGDSNNRQLLQEDLNISRQCLEMCQMGNEVLSQKSFRIREVAADGKRDQVVVTTLADLFNVKRALSTENSAQFFGPIERDNFQQLVTERYENRFESVANISGTGQGSNIGSRISHASVPRGRPNEQVSLQPSNQTPIYNKSFTQGHRGYPQTPSNMSSEDSALKLPHQTSRISTLEAEGLSLDCGISQTENLDFIINPLDGYKIAWICASPVEAAAARCLLDKTHTVPRQVSDPNAYGFGELNGHRIVIAYLPNDVYETVSAATVESRIRLTFPRLPFGLMVGIGGEVPSKNNNIRLDDVVVSRPGGKHDRLIQYDHGKTAGHSEPTGIVNQLPQALLTRLDQLEAEQWKIYESTIAKIVSHVLKHNPTMKGRLWLIDDVDLLGQVFADPGRYKHIQNPVMTAWNQILNQNPVAVDELSFMLCTNLRTMPRSIFPSQITKKQTLNALGFLNAYSFIKTQESSISMHQIVRSATKNWLRKDGLLAHRLEKVAERMQEVLPDDQKLAMTLAPFNDVSISNPTLGMDKQTTLEKEVAKFAVRPLLLTVREIFAYYDSRESKEWHGYAAPTAAAYAKPLLSKASPPSGLVQSRRKFGIMAEKTTEDENTFKRRKEEIIAFEMGAAGLTSHNPALIIRGITDYADSTKSRLWRDYAAQTGTQFLKELREFSANIRGIDGLPQWSDLTTNVSSSPGVSGNISFSMPGLNSRSDFYRVAIVYLINHFATDAELLALYEEAVQQMNETSFINNHQHLLKIYYLELEFKNQDPSQRQTIVLLRKQRERHFLSHQIYHAVRSPDTPNQGRKRTLLDPDERQLRLLNMFLEKNTNNSAASQNTAGTSTDTEWYTESEGSDSDADSTDSCLAFPELKSRARFLCEGQPYKQYKEQLRNLALHKARNQAKKSQFGAIQAQPEVEMPEIHENTRPKRPIVAGEMESQPSSRWNFLDKTVKLLQNVRFQPSQQLCDRFLWLRRLLRPKLKAGYYRIEWQCDCGAHLHADFPPGDSESINNLARSLTNGGRSQINLPADNGNNKISSQNIPGYTLHDNLQSQISTTQNFVQQHPLGSVRPKFLALCVNTGSFYKTLVEIDASEITSDAKAFLHMKKKYLQTRSHLSHLNFLVKPVTVEFVQFTLWNLRRGYISVCDRPDRIPPDDSSDYEYIPKPLEPPIPMPPEVFIHYLEHNEGDLSHARNTWFNRLPKRLNRRVVDGDEGTYGWGIHIIEGPDREVIFWLIMITIFGSMLASILWTVLHNDIQGGTGLGTMIVALPPAILTAFLFRMGAI